MDRKLIFAIVLVLIFSISIPLVLKPSNNTRVLGESSFVISNTIAYSRSFNATVHYQYGYQNDQGFLFLWTHAGTVVFLDMAILQEVQSNTAICRVTKNIEVNSTGLKLLFKLDPKAKHSTISIFPPIDQTLEQLRTYDESVYCQGYGHYSVVDIDFSS